MEILLISMWIIFLPKLFSFASMTTNNTKEEGFFTPTMISSQHPLEKKGIMTVHDDSIAHGVTLLESGVRYGLFLLKKNK